MNKRTRKAGVGSKKETEKSTRVPISQQDKLRAQKRPGYERRYVNNILDGQRVQSFLEAGWTFVEKPNQEVATDDNAGTQIDTRVYRNVGSGTKAFLMEIPTKFYNEDQKAKQSAIDAQEGGMKRDQSKEVRHDGTYGKLIIE